MEAVTPSAAGRFTSRILANRQFSPNAFELTMAKPVGFTFSAGQRVRLEYAGTQRDYSIASAPDEADIRLCIRQAAGGRVSASLARGGAGVQLTFTGPHGYFTFKASGRPAVFVATGTGIAPFCAIAGSGVGGFLLLHGVKTTAELFYREFIQARAAAYVACLSVDRASDAAQYTGRVTDYIRSRLLPRAYDFYLCGRQDMIRDVTLLIDERFDGSFVYSEPFY
jgi:ferredoxin-NADP reductase